MALRISIQSNSIVFTDTDTNTEYPFNKAFVEPRYTDTQVYFEHLFHPYFIVPPNSDVRLIAVASSASTDVSGSIQGYLAEIY